MASSHRFFFIRKCFSDARSGNVPFYDGLAHPIEITAQFQMKTLKMMTFLTYKIFFNILIVFRVL